MIAAERFFELMVEESAREPQLLEYYKFAPDRPRFEFRKSYFLRRLTFILDHVGPKPTSIWDIGCGYGTTAIFLSLNGHTVHGSTLESYMDVLTRRIQFWTRFGDLRKFTFIHEDMFAHHASRPYGRIILQDTLHHLEPITLAIQTIASALGPDGLLIAVEENGNNMIQATKNFIRRGNKRVVEVYDEKLGRNFLMGNENTRSFENWRQILGANGLQIVDRDYIRFLPPVFWSNNLRGRLERLERSLWPKSTFLREFFFFGLNFTATHAQEPE